MIHSFSRSITENRFSFGGFLGEANFEIYTMSGHQNDSCDLTFSLDSNSTLQVSQIQATTCSILLYGCSAEYELQEGEQYDSCVPSEYPHS